MHIAWYSEDKPFAVGYADGKLLIGSKEPLEKGAIVVIDAHKVKQLLHNHCVYMHRRSICFVMYVKQCTPWENIMLKSINELRNRG